MDGSETRGYPVLVFLHSLLSCCPGRWCFTSHNQQEEKTETAWTECSASLKKRRRNFMCWIVHLLLPLQHKCTTSIAD